MEAIPREERERRQRICGKMTITKNRGIKGLFSRSAVKLSTILLQMSPLQVSLRITWQSIWQCSTDSASSFFLSMISTRTGKGFPPSCRKFPARTECGMWLRTRRDGPPLFFCSETKDRVPFVSTFCDVASKAFLTRYQASRSEEWYTSNHLQIANERKIFKK